jgi:aspartyl-tRNA(Asn)/glutamyl-tRNA(Gln) amidotransferase subunit A
MGSTSRTSYFGAPLNPWNKEKISGGSSGGSAVTIAARDLPFALGSDTGGSIRQPASYCGIVGMKPTYGRVSRYGLVAFASSMDQIGPMTKNVYENALLLNAIVGKDNKDLTSANKESEDFTRLIGEDIKGMKIAAPNYFMSDIVNDEVRKTIESTIEMLKEKGATVDYVDMKYLDQAVTLYQVIALGEASSNLARFDGIRYGFSYENPENIKDLYLKTRQDGFGTEVKRRIMVGAHILSGENAKIYYDKAMSVRAAMRKEFKRIYKDYDLIIGPTTTDFAYKLGEGVNDAVKSFTDDLLTIPVNMAGLPGMSIPVGFGTNKLPMGMQIIGKKFDEATMYKLASYIEENYEGGRLC